MRDGFLGGVVEGFYGQPWSYTQRRELFAMLSEWGLNAYFYAPKDDLKHRAIWRETYEASELAELASLIESCHQRQLTFIYGLSPGLDIHFSDPTEIDTLKRRIEQLVDVGARNFALLFDDLPGRMSDQDRQVYGSVADAQCAVTNSIYQWLRGQALGRMLFCPTPYCDRMDRARLGGDAYLTTIGQRLDAEIDILWTGPEIISSEIPVESIRRLSKRIGRPPIIWDNLHANDYDWRRLYCGPYSGRSAELLGHVRGILANPNCEFPINYVPLRTFAKYLEQGPDYQPRAAFVSAIDEWIARFETVGSRVSRDDLTLLADCYYLPHEEGPESLRLQALVVELLERSVDSWGAAYGEFLELHGRVLRLFEELTQLKDRELFYAWSRRIWELREELDLIADFLARKHAGDDPARGFDSQTHLLGTYRGGTVAKLQRHLTIDEHGRFHQIPIRD